MASSSPTPTKKYLYSVLRTTRNDMVGASGEVTCRVVDIYDTLEDANERAKGVLTNLYARFMEDGAGFFERWLNTTDGILYYDEETGCLWMRDYPEIDKKYGLELLIKISVFRNELRSKSPHPTPQEPAQPARHVSLPGINTILPQAPLPQTPLPQTPLPQAPQPQAPLPQAPPPAPTGTKRPLSNATLPPPKRPTPSQQITFKRLTIYELIHTHLSDIHGRHHEYSIETDRKVKSHTYYISKRAALEAFYEEGIENGWFEEWSDEELGSDSEEDEERYETRYERRRIEEAEYTRDGLPWFESETETCINDRELLEVKKKAVELMFRPNGRKKKAEIVESLKFQDWDGSKETFDLMFGGSASSVVRGEGSIERPVVID